MKKTHMMLAILPFLLTLSCVQALNICDFNHVPQYVSLNSSMLLIIPNDTANEFLGSFARPIRVEWQITDEYFVPVPGRTGNMHRFGDCWVCEFSGEVSDFYGSCGSMPFTESVVSRINYFAGVLSRFEVEFNDTIDVRPGKISVITNVDNNGSVYMTVDAPSTTSYVWLSLYDAVSGELLEDYSQMNMSSTSFPGRYTMAVSSLPIGVYYGSITFETSSGSRGGTLSKFEIGASKVTLSAETSKDSYWAGETVSITGETQGDSVTATVRHPSGTIENLGTESVSGGTFRYSMQTTPEYTDGMYTLTVSTGTSTAQKTFEVKKLFSINPSSITFTASESSGQMSRNITITNLGNSSITVSARKSGLTSHVSLGFVSKSIPAGGTEELSVSVDGSLVTTTSSGTVIVSSSGVSLSSEISLNYQPDNSASGANDPVLKITPGLWSNEDCVAGQEIGYSFTVQNTGEGVLENFGHTATGAEVSSITFPDPIEAGSLGSLSIKVIPVAGGQTGSVAVTSSGGTETIYVSFDCIEDINDDISITSDDIDSLKSDYLEAGFSSDAISVIFSGADTDLYSSSSSMEAGEYSDAKESYVSARTKYEALSSVLNEIGTAPASSSGGSGSTTMIIIIVAVIAVIGVVGFILYNKFGSKISGKGSDEEGYEEEEYY